MNIVHKRERFNRNCIASSRGSYVMHAHKQMLSENHSSEKSLTLFAAVKEHTPVYYLKCWGKLIPITPEQAATFPQDVVVIM